MYTLHNCTYVLVYVIRKSWHAALLEDYILPSAICMIHVHVKPAYGSIIVFMYRRFVLLLPTFHWQK